MHRPSFAEATHASDLDIDDAARAKLDRRLCIATSVYCLIEANRGAELTLQLRVKVKVVMPERLLDHEQVETVKLFQVFDLIEPVRRVGIAAQKNLRPAAADPVEDFYIPSRLALDFDATIARAQFRLDLPKQLVDGILN